MRKRKSYSNYRVSALIDEQQRVFGEPDESMREFGKYVREKQLSDITDVRIMLQVWRE